MYYLLKGLLLLAKMALAMGLLASLKMLVPLQFDKVGRSSFTYETLVRLFEGVS